MARGPKKPKTLDQELDRAVKHFDTAVELATDEVQLFKIRSTFFRLLKEVSPQ